jgi:hypothetical protein
LAPVTPVQATSTETFHRRLRKMTRNTATHNTQPTTSKQSNCSPVIPVQARSKMKTAQKLITVGACSWTTAMLTSPTCARLCACIGLRLSDQAQNDLRRTPHKTYLLCCNSVVGEVRTSLVTGLTHDQELTTFGARMQPRKMHAPWPT